MKRQRVNRLGSSTTATATSSHRSHLSLPSFDGTPRQAWRHDTEEETEPSLSTDAIAAAAVKDKTDISFLSPSNKAVSQRRSTNENLKSSKTAVAPWQLVSNEALKNSQNEKELFAKHPTLTFALGYEKILQGRQRRETRKRRKGLLIQNVVQTNELKEMLQENEINEPNIYLKEQAAKRFERKKKLVFSKSARPLMSNNPVIQASAFNNQQISPVKGFNKSSRFPHLDRGQDNSAKRKLERTNSDLCIDAGIYMLQNKRSGHTWFGSTWDLSNAKKQNLRDMAAGEHSHLALSQLVQAYGESFVTFTVLERIPVRDGFDFREFEKVLRKRQQHHMNRMVNRKVERIITAYRLKYFKMYWSRWHQTYSAEIMDENIAAAIEIQRIFRSYVDRKKAYNLRRFYAARLIQSTVRMFLVRLHAARIRHKQQQNSAASTIQRNWRTVVAKREAKRRLRLVRMHGNIRDIQRVYRGHLGRKQARRLRLHLRRDASATNIQRMWRGVQAREQVARQVHRRFLYVQARHIQRVVRGHQARRRISTLTKARTYNRFLHQQARLIQESYRYYLGRKLAWYASRYALEVHMALRLQRAWGRYQGRKFQALGTTYPRAYHAAGRIRRMYLSWKTRQRVKNMRVYHLQSNRATCIQRIYRGYRARRLLHHMRGQAHLAKCARRLQRTWRAYRSGWLRRLATRFRATSRAAVRVQSRFRAHRARRRYVAARARHRREAAARLIQGHLRIRWARKARARKAWLKAHGACQECKDELATLYCENFELELCQACFETLKEYDREDFDFEEEDDDDEEGEEEIERLRSTSTYKCWSIETYRDRGAKATKIQALYRGVLVRRLKRWGKCSDCELPKQVHCFACKSAFCRSCASLLHSREAMKSHELVNYEEFATREAAAVIIQKYVRRYLRRNLLEEMRFQQRSAAAKRIQAWWRVRRSRYTAFVSQQSKRVRRAIEQGSAKLIQRNVRRWLAQIRLQRRILKKKSAILIQRYTRGYLVWLRYQRLKQEILEARRKAAAIKIQCMVRQRLAHRLVQKKRENAAATRLQCAFKCYRARGIAKKKRVHRRAAIIIQSMFRCCKAKWTVREKRRIQAALTIQCFFRGAKAREHLRRLIRERNERVRLAMLELLQAKEAAAATKIQSLFRKRLAKRLLEKRKREFTRNRRMKERERYLRIERLAAETIQRMVRRKGRYVAHAATRIQCICRRNLAKAKTAALRKECKTKREAAIKIQSVVRRRRAQKYVQQIRWSTFQLASSKPASSSWGEYWDDSAQCFYYYHAETGETRWEKPADFQDDVVAMLHNPQNSSVYTTAFAEDDPSTTALTTDVLVRSDLYPSLLYSQSSEVEFTASYDDLKTPLQNGLYVRSTTSSYYPLETENEASSMYLNTASYCTNHQGKLDDFGNETSHHVLDSEVYESDTYLNNASFQNYAAAAAESYDSTATPIESPWGLLTESNSREEWEEVFDAQHNASYYYNHRTGESSWEIPKDAAFYDDVVDKYVAEVRIEEVEDENAEEIQVVEGDFSFSSPTEEGWGNDVYYDASTDTT